VAAALGIGNVEISPEDFDMYSSPANALPPYFPAAADLPPAKDFSPVTNCRIISLPGHTKGGSGFLFDDGTEKFLIAGDTIFCGSIGRTDLPGGDFPTLQKSLARLTALPDGTRVIPGHGEHTTIGREKAANPFLV
jgi:glyoxylase-like metal-dependent hydrolase (beta-lactamase superfamily II)